MKYFYINELKVSQDESFENFEILINDCFFLLKLTSYQFYYFNYYRRFWFV